MLTQDRLWSEAVILEAGENRVLRVQSTRDAFLCLKITGRLPTEKQSAMPSRPASG